MVTNYCKKLPVCAFFKATQESDEVLDVLSEYVHVYCCGPLKHKCHRIIHLDRFGVPAADNISPSGLDFRKYVDFI